MCESPFLVSPNVKLSHLFSPLCNNGHMQVHFLPNCRNHQQQPKKNTTRKTIQKYFSACGAFKQTQKQRPRTPNRRLNWEPGTAEAVDGGASFAFDLSALKAVDGKVLNMCKN